jgi:hypothetical protein
MRRATQARRARLGALGLISLLAAPHLAAQEDASTTPPRPNILFALAHDHRIQGRLLQRQRWASRTMLATKNQFCLGKTVTNLLD